MVLSPSSDLNCCIGPNSGLSRSVQNFLTFATRNKLLKLYIMFDKRTCFIKNSPILMSSVNRHVYKH